MAGHARVAGNSNPMSERTYEALRHALREHPDLALGTEESCLRALREAGAGDGPEAALIAGAVGARIPHRLMRGEAVDIGLARELAAEMASARNLPREAANFAVASWAAALGVRASKAQIPPAIIPPKPSAAPGTVARLVATHGTAIRDDSIFFAPQIPEKKLAGALRSYAPGALPADALALVDNTVFGSAKNGALLTAYFLYAREALEQPKRVALAEIRTAHLAEGIWSSSLHINDSKFVDFVVPEKASLRGFVELLRAIAKENGPI